MNRIKHFIAAAALALPLASSAVDLEKGKEIYGPCAACHGEFGAGGKKGEYPRVAGLSAKYIMHSLKSFQNQTRLNIPMIPYTKERELPDEDMKVVAEYLEQIVLPTKMPEFKETDDALTRLLAVDKIMIVPRVEGDIVAGGATYQKQCAGCHGKTGLGKGMFPRLVGQYTNYLKRQIDSFLKAERPHDEETAKEGVLYALKADEIQNVLAYLTSIQEIDKD